MSLFNILSEAEPLDQLLLRCDLSCDGNLRLFAEFLVSNALLVESAALDLTSGLQRGDDVLVLPADLVGETSEHTKLPALLQAQHFEAAGHDEALLLVVGSGDALEHLHPVQSLLSAVQLVGEHTAHRPPEDLARASEMVRASLWVGVMTLTQEGQVLELVTVEATGDVDSFASQDNNTLTL